MPPEKIKKRKKSQTRKYRLPKSGRYFKVDAEIGKYLMDELAGKSILGTSGLIPIEELRAHSKDDIMREMMDVGIDVMSDPQYQRTAVDLHRKNGEKVILKCLQCDKELEIDYETYKNVIE